jgi:hypothetical protein
MHAAETGRGQTHNHPPAHLVGGHAHVLEDERAVHEEQVVGVAAVQRSGRDEPMLGGHTSHLTRKKTMTMAARHRQQQCSSASRLLSSQAVLQRP